MTPTQARLHQERKERLVRLGSAPAHAPKLPASVPAAAPPRAKPGPKPNAEPLPARNPLSANAIIARVAEAHGFSFSVLQSPRRDKRACEARHLAAYLCRELAHRSFPDIARRLGRADHTTARHGYVKVMERIARDAEYAAHVEALKAQIVPSSI